MGNIFYGDRTSTAGLVDRYNNNKVLDRSKILTVDFVWGERSLKSRCSSPTSASASTVVAS